MDKFHERKVLGLQVKCNKRGDGCAWIGELRDLQVSQLNNNINLKVGNSNVLIRNTQMMDVILLKFIVNFCLLDVLKRYAYTSQTDRLINRHAN